MDRRHYLALVGSGLALSTAGCTGGDGDNGGDDSSNGGENGGENGGGNGDANSGDNGSDDAADDQSSSDDSGDDGSSSDGSDPSDDNGSTDGGSSDDGSTDDGSGDDGSSDDDGGSENGGDNDEGDESSFSDATELLQLSALGDRDPPYFGTRTTVSGTGDTVSEPFYLADGVVGFVYEHDGESNFIAEAVDPNTGDTLSVVVNEIGAVAGARAVPAAVGAYQLAVQADGQWEIVVVEPLPPKGAVRTPPASIERAGNAVVGPVALNGGETVTASHDGEGNFIVTTIAESATSGRGTELVFNEIGPVDSAQTILSMDAWTWIDVVADGDWSLTLE